MHVLKKYKAVLLSGLLVVVFCVAAYCAVGRADSADSQYTYAEHIFQDDMVNEINIEIDEKDWQDMLDNPLEEEYHKANITINGETVGNVAIRTKGNNSLTSVASSDSDRYSFKIDFDYYDDNGNYYGLKKLCLNTTIPTTAVCANILPIKSWANLDWMSPNAATATLPLTVRNGDCIWRWRQ